MRAAGRAALSGAVLLTLLTGSGCVQNNHCVKTRNCGNKNSDVDGGGDDSGDGGGDVGGDGGDAVGGNRSPQSSPDSPNGGTERNRAGVMSVDARYKMYVTPQTFIDLDRRSAVSAPEDAADSEFYVTGAGQSFQFADAQGGPGTALVEYGLIRPDEIPNCAALTPTSSYVFLDAMRDGTGLCVHTSDHRWVLVQPSTGDPSTGDWVALDVSYLESS